MDFDTDRHAVTVEYKGKSVTFYIRELGYYEFQEINDEAARAFPRKEDKDRRGMKVMHDTAIAAVEDQDGNPVFTEKTWKRLPKEPAMVLTVAAMKWQGIDLEEAKKHAKEPEDEQGNA